MARALFGELKSLYANSVWITKKQRQSEYFKAIYDIPENLSLQVKVPEMVISIVANLY